MLEGPHHSDITNNVKLTSPGSLYVAQAGQMWPRRRLLLVALCIGGLLLLLNVYSSITHVGSNADNGYILKEGLGVFHGENLTIFKATNCANRKVSMDYIDQHPRDLEALKKQRECLKWLPNYRNPCWEEDAEDIDHDERNNFYYTVGEAKGHKLEIASTHRSVVNGKEVRCLPFFYLAGQPKCGTTDLFHNLMQHQRMVPSTLKEPHWWSRRRLGFDNHNKSVPFDNYVSLFEEASGIISRENISGFHQMITGEASASTFWNNNYWCEGQASCREGQYQLTTAQYIHALQPQARFVVILRDPTDRLYSDFLYFNNAVKDAERFHNLVSDAVEGFKECEEQRGTRQCVYNVSFYKRHRMIRLLIGIYYIYLEDWIKVFGKGQIYVVRLEDYSKDKMSTLNSIFHFLGVGPLSEAATRSIIGEGVHNKRSRTDKQVGPMLQKTRTLLNDFHRPYNKRLAEILENPNFLWER